MGSSSEESSSTTGWSGDANALGEGLSPALGDAGRIFGDDADSTLLDASFPGEKTPGDAIGDSTGDDRFRPGDPLDVPGRGGDFRCEGGGFSGLPPFDGESSKPGMVLISFPAFFGLPRLDGLASLDGLTGFGDLTGLSFVGDGTGKSSSSVSSSSSCSIPSPPAYA
jgi:hypothetical protein